jgi:CHAT domain-containing protein/Tfp pilus assembly protein PilF
MTVTYPSSAGDFDEETRLYIQAKKLRKQCKYAEAAKMGERALAMLAIKEKALEPDYPQIAWSLNNFAWLYHKMGDYEKAEPLYKRSLAIREKNLKSDAPKYGNRYEIGKVKIAYSHKDLAFLYWDMGDYAKAMPLLKRAIAIVEKTLGFDHPRAATSLGGLAMLYFEMGDYAKAEPLLKRTLAIDKKAMGFDHPRSITDTDNLASLYYKMGDYAKAEPLYYRSLGMREDLMPGHPDIAISLNHVALLFSRRGNYVKAESFLKRSLAIREKAFGPDHPEIAWSLNSLATLYRTMGDYEKAEPLLKRSLAIREKALGPDHPDIAMSLNKLAFFYGIKGRNQKSLDLFQRGLAIEDRVIQNIFTIASEKQKLGFVKTLSGNFNAVLSFIHQKSCNDQEALRMGLNIILSRKGVVFDAQTRQREAMANSLDPEARELWEKLSSNRAYLAKLLQGKPEKMPSEDYRSGIESLQSEIEDLESQLASMSGLVAEELEQRKATTEKVAGRLPKDAVLAEFVRIRDYDWSKGEWGKTTRYLAFILHPDQKIELIDLGDADKLDAEVQTALARLKKHEYTHEAIKEQIAAAEKLYSLLWKPLSGNIGCELFPSQSRTICTGWYCQSGKVIVSPDGDLNLVPFGALRDPDGKFLAESRTVTYVTSGRDLLRGGAGIEPELDLFLAANPKFDFIAKAEVPGDAGITRGRFRSAGFSLSFQPLPGTALEAETIPGLLPGEDKSIVKGVEATESSVLNVKRPRTLHLATHGFFLKDQERLVSDEKGFMSDRIPTLPKGYENPLVRSGLAFTGANNAAKAGTSMDGLLTALEISGMDLHGTELVTLSACETGVGEVKAGEGVFGLRRAFALSGTKNLLMSLWSVADEITAEQMITFYRLYGKGESPAEALRNAQLETIAKLREEYDGFAPPSLWAPFILQGVSASQ